MKYIQQVKSLTSTENLNFGVKQNKQDMQSQVTCLVLQQLFQLPIPHGCLCTWAGTNLLI